MVEINKRLLGIAGLCFLVASAITACQLLFSQPQHPNARWTMAEGNSQTEWDVYDTGAGISGLALDGDIIWATSSGGLLRWERDTGNVTQYLFPRFPLPGNSPDDIFILKGKLYISGSMGLSIFDRRDNWTFYSREEIGLELGYIVPMATDGEIVVVAGNNGIAKLLPDGRWETILAGTVFPPDAKAVKIEVHEDEVYLIIRSKSLSSGDEILLRYSNGEWKYIDLHHNAYWEGPEGTLWKYERQGKFLDTWHRIFRSTNQGSAWQKVLDVDWPAQFHTFDDQGRVYASSEDEIFVIDGKRVTEAYRFTDLGPTLTLINIIKWDNQGRLWVAMDGNGLTMYDGQKWRNWQPENSALRDDAIRGLAIGDNYAYAGTYNSYGSSGVSILDIKSERWSNLWPGTSPLSGGDVRGIAVSPEGRVYFPTISGILDIFDGVNWEHVPMPLPEGYGLITTEGLFDRDGNYWVAASGFGVWRYDGVEWLTYDIGQETDRTAIETIAMDSEGRLWAGTSDGLVVRDLDANWYFYTAEQLPVGDRWVEDLAIDLDGRVWLISSHFLIAFNGKDYQTFPPEILGEDFWGESLAFDADGQLWVGTISGLAVFKGKPDISPFTGLTLPPSKIVPESEVVHKPEYLAPLPDSTTSFSSESIEDFLVIVQWIQLFLLIIFLVGATVVISFIIIRKRKKRQK